MIDVDMVMKMDLEYCKIFEKFYNDYEYFSEVFVCVWFKLIYCDFGFKVCYIGLDVLEEILIW